MCGMQFNLIVNQTVQLQAWWVKSPGSHCMQALRRSKILKILWLLSICDLNRSFQHLNSSYRDGDVVISISCQLLMCRRKIYTIFWCVKHFKRSNSIHELPSFLTTYKWTLPKPPISFSLNSQGNSLSNFEISLIVSPACSINFVSKYPNRFLSDG